MKIKSMLMRLQNALGQKKLGEQMLLFRGATATQHQSNDTANFVIGYSGSPNSQTALDFIFWMAHQTRLATRKQVIVHVVYVVDCFKASTPSTGSIATGASARQSSAIASSCGTTSLKRQHSSATTSVMESPAAAAESLANLLEQADRVLWQARCLSDEWRGSLEAHLRFGGLATELREVVAATNADLLFVGCTDADHALVQQLMPDLSCPILGIPTELEAA